MRGEGGGRIENMKFQMKRVLFNKDSHLTFDEPLILFLNTFCFETFHEFLVDNETIILNFIFLQPYVIDLRYKKYEFC